MDHAFRVRSPGRVNLIGEHTDYTGGEVLPLATDLQTQIDATPSDTVTVTSAAMDSEHTFGTDDLDPTDEWVDYVRGCYAILQDEGYDPGGVTAEISATLPMGSGLSSSASLVVGVMALIDAIEDLGLTREQIALLSQRVENDYVGVSCGIMDQLAVAMGREGHALRIDTGRLDVSSVPVPEELRIVVAHTGIERELVDSAYNERRQTVERALERLGAESSRAVSESDLDRLSGVERERLGYVVRENARVDRASDALAAGDCEAFGDLLVESHRDIADHFEASCPELDYLVEVSVEEGAYGARLTGAGWGGAAIAIVDADSAAAFADRLSDRYDGAFQDRDGEIHLVTPSAGVRVERL